ncbi:MAG: ribose 5-phosphate isomerase B [Bacteroidales bacterium]|nr:ribose 5-phosphate isomerase B [Bacteroidales bacterium]MBP5582910.1 ribose 5-phosphate isomerase B [Bacteroidales bacterium]
MEKTTIAMACDHAGFQMKEFIKKQLLQEGYEIVDYGTDSDASVDYPDFAHKVGEAISNGTYSVGLVLCGSGNGVNMTVNKHKGVRSALCWNEEIARLARAHNNANVCALPARFIPAQEAWRIVQMFLNSEFEGGRHINRVNKIDL